MSRSPDPHGRGAGPATASVMTPAVAAWSLYDFANTIFSFAVITRYFNEWMIEERGQPDWHLGLMSFIVGVALVLVLPVVGAATDRTGRRMLPLATATLVCIAATAGIGVVASPAAGMALAAVAIFSYQIALSLYDPLLAVVAPPGRQGAVSGIGVGVGYIGSLVGAIVLLALVGDGDKQRAFLPTAAMFAVFALPLFLVVRDPTRRAVERIGIPASIRAATRQAVVTAAQIRSTHRDVGRFLVARFLYVDAIATVISIMTVYVHRVGGFDERDVTLLMVFASISAAVGAIAAGRIVEAVGPKRVLVTILVVSTLALVTTGATGSAAVVWVLGPVVGISLGAVWTSDRVLMMRLAPPDLRGEMFGFYNLVGKLSSGVGPLILWGGTIWVLHGRSGALSILDASRVAMITLAVAILLGIHVLLPVPDAEPTTDEPTGAAA